MKLPPIDRAALGALVASAVLLAIAPFGLAASYSPIEHTTSESAAQGVDGAWVARLGFVVFGVAVLIIVWRRRSGWGQPGWSLHALFGVCMFAVAAFSARSWVADAPFDETEDTLHSVGATVMGFAFALGVVSVAVYTLRQGDRVRWLDWVAVGAATVLPILMGAFPDIDGLLQRVMFAVAYVWFGVNLFVRREHEQIELSRARDLT